jgi:hypothetical protein
VKPDGRKQSRNINLIKEYYGLDEEDFRNKNFKLMQILKCSRHSSLNTLDRLWAGWSRTQNSLTDREEIFSLSLPTDRPCCAPTYSSVGTMGFFPGDKAASAIRCNK